MAIPSPEIEALDLPFPGSTGRGVRIAVIDSGVNQRHPHVSDLAGGICVGESGALEEGDYSDYLGHGTAVTAAIQEKAPGAEYFGVRLFQKSLRASTEGLFNALEWAISQRVDVINLSLGTRNAAHAPRFKAVIERALERNVMLVAAREADGDRCYPGSLAGVISVALDWDCPRERYRYQQTPEGPVFHASGFPRSLPGVTRERNLNGISFAVANMSGFVARACETIAERSYAEVCRALSTEALPSPELQFQEGIAT